MNATFETVIRKNCIPSFIFSYNMLFTHECIYLIVQNNLKTARRCWIALFWDIFMIVAQLFYLNDYYSKSSNNMKDEFSIRINKKFIQNKKNSYISLK